MPYRLLILAVILLSLSTTAMAGVANRYGKNKHSSDPNDAENFISAYKTEQPAETAAAPSDADKDQMMQSTMQSMMNNLPKDGLDAFAKCIEKYVDPQTANSLAAKTTAGNGATPGSYAATQEFMASPQGQMVMQNCNAEIQALLPAAQQQQQAEPELSKGKRIHSKSH